MREPRKAKKKIDLTVPVSLDDSDDCFGKEWIPSNSSCAMCADVDICGIKHQEQVLQKKVTEVDKTLPLDMTAFERVNFKKIAGVIKKHQSREPVLYDELVEMVGDLAQTKDKDTIKAYFRRQFPKYDVVIDNSKLYISDGKTVTDKK